MPTVTAVLLAYGAEPWLEDAVRAVLASVDVDIDVVVVDNGCTSAAIDRVKGLNGVRVITPDANTGYSGGCDRGAAEATGEYLAFVNSDAIVAPDALSRLAAVAAEPAVGLAMGSIRLADAPGKMNTAGNPVHFTGLSWAGGFDEPAAGTRERRSVTAGSGCCFVIRRDLWEQLGGFAPEYFAYCEDTELSLRLWQQGRTVEYVPDAVVRHHYEFSRNERKLYLLERNRAAPAADHLRAAQPAGTGADAGAHRAAHARGRDRGRLGRGQAARLALALAASRLGPGAAGSDPG